MRKTVVLLGLGATSVAGAVAGFTVAAQQEANPRQQPGAMITMYAPEQHDLYENTTCSLRRLHGRPRHVGQNQRLDGSSAADGIGRVTVAAERLER